MKNKKTGIIRSIVLKLFRGIPAENSVSGKKIVSKTVFNKDRKFGSSETYVYIPQVHVIRDCGNVELTPLLFTAGEIKKAELRAINNREDYHVQPE